LPDFAAQLHGGCAHFFISFDAIYSSRLESVPSLTRLRVGDA